MAKCGALAGPMYRFTRRVMCPVRRKSGSKSRARFLSPLVTTKPPMTGSPEAFEPVKCHHFITESTFGLPVFNWQPQARVADEINTWWADCAAQGKTAFLGAYALGKAQRLLSMLDPEIGPILTHTAVENTNVVLRKQGYKLPATVLAGPDIAPKDHPGALVLSPPSALGSQWAREIRPIGKRICLWLDGTAGRAQAPPPETVVLSFPTTQIGKV